MFFSIKVIYLVRHKVSQYVKIFIVKASNIFYYTPFPIKRIDVLALSNVLVVLVYYITAPRQCQEKKQLFIKKGYSRNFSQ